jgi:NADH-quinone oxidoreductase subunit I
MLAKGMPVSRPKLTFMERVYVVEVLKGLYVTSRHFFKNMSLHTLHLFGIAKRIPAAVTLQYPEQKRPYPERFRGSHRLTLKPDGSVRCTACMLCATACPSHCITIEAGEHPDSNVEKYPLRYDIDTILCIYCGDCVEACPVDAIRMDTGLHPNPRYTREGFVDRIDLLKKRSEPFSAVVI